MPRTDRWFTNTIAPTSGYYHLLFRSSIATKQPVASLGVSASVVRTLKAWGACQALSHAVVLLLEDVAANQLHPDGHLLDKDQYPGSSTLTIGPTRLQEHSRGSLLRLL